jgi:hypothetical protein
MPKTDLWFLQVMQSVHDSGFVTGNFAQLSEVRRG